MIRFCVVLLLIWLCFQLCEDQADPPPHPPVRNISIIKTTTGTSSLSLRSASRFVLFLLNILTPSTGFRFPISLGGALEACCRCDGNLHNCQEFSVCCRYGNAVSAVSDGSLVRRRFVHCFYNSEIGFH